MCIDFAKLSYLLSHDLWVVYPPQASSHRRRPSSSRLISSKLAKRAKEDARGRPRNQGSANITARFTLVPLFSIEFITHLRIAKPSLLVQLLSNPRGSFFDQFISCSSHREFQVPESCLLTSASENASYPGTLSIPKT